MAPARKGCTPIRTIDTYPPGKVDTKTGITVNGGIACYSLQLNQKFAIDYSVIGRKLIDRVGEERSGRSCEIVGKVTCDTYPAKLLRQAEFQDDRPERFDLWVEIQTDSPQGAQNLSKTFTMGTSREKLVVDGGLEIWIEEINGSYALMASGPGSLRQKASYIKQFDAQMLHQAKPLGRRVDERLLKGTTSKKR